MTSLWNTALGDTGVPFQMGEPLSRHTTFRIGGPAALMALPRTAGEAKAAVKAARALEVEPFFLGNGSNLLAADEGLDALVVHTGRLDRLERTGERTLRAQAGVSLARLASFAQREGLAGLANYIVKSPVRKKAWSASKNLVDPEPRIRDGRISGKKARELDEHRQDSTRFEALYPGYLMSGPAEVFHNEVNGGCYLVARLYKKGGKFIRPELKRRN